MKCVIALIAAFWIGQAHAPPAATQYLGEVATRAGAANDFSSTYKYVQTRSCHYIRSAFTSVQIEIPNWQNGGTEVNPGASATVTAGIEFPTTINTPGTITQVTFSSSTSATIANGGNVLSDAISISGSFGALMCVRIWYHNTAGVLFSDLVNDSAIGDAMNESATVISDQTLGGTVVNNSGTGIFLPAAIVAQTTAPAICFFGDSRLAGYTDTGDSTGDYGAPARSIGGTFGYIWMATPGREGSEFVASHTNEVALAAYCSHGIVNYGINDIINGASSGTVETTLQSTWGIIGPALQTPAVVDQDTLEPVTGTTDNWMTTGNQTNLYPAAQTVSEWIATIPSGLNGFFDVANQIESSTNSGIWIANGSQFYYTGDGIHPTAAGIVVEVNSGATIPTSAFHRP